MDISIPPNNPLGLRPGTYNYEEVWYWTQEQGDWKAQKYLKNILYLMQTTEVQAAIINDRKKYRWRDKHVPSYIRDEIDMTDVREVKTWESIDHTQRYPFLRHKAPDQYPTKGTVQVGREIFHGVVLEYTSEYGMVAHVECRVEQLTDPSDLLSAKQDTIMGIQTYRIERRGPVWVAV